ncbi:AAA domain containing protein [uncultured Caudovirales phage]|uniref:AAA domain containing protein n=1 Tax=uncultured Caudovirales phage TaxID=2100421 RepID=A0A6J5T9H5_9CAUD|nr:AAA domain containing protein [uncultured Caudovirales phage]CAB4241231.1 AAA domain containing protein [uncultured Caudovirales phage]CAB5078978.1 AAA domain containing protein [uncultured Caudovirales phage]
MALHIISADERLATRQKVNIALFGPSGSGKTFQANTLDPAKTLFVDLEAGTLAIQSWRGDVISVRDEATKLGVHPWQFARAIICLLGGPDPSQPDSSPYSKVAFANYEQALGAAAMFDKYDTIFIDSITVASRMAFAWSKTQPEALSEKTGKPDNRGAYGLLGQELTTWLTQAQHVRSKNIIVVGILDVGKDDFGRPTFEPQIEGSKAARELPGIFDQVITLGLFDMSSGSPVFDLLKGTQRGFICHQNNGYGVPAKDRSGRLDGIEAPDLGAIIKKIQNGPRQDAPVFSPPASTAAESNNEGQNL